MSAVGVLIVFAVLGSIICAKARVAGGAVVFALLAMTLFIGTPAGAGLPGMVSSFLSTVQRAATPLTDGSDSSAGVR